MKTDSHCVNAGTSTGAAGLGGEEGGVAPANQRDVSQQMTRSIHHHTPHLVSISTTNSHCVNAGACTGAAGLGGEERGVAPGGGQVHQVQERASQDPGRHQ